MHIPVWLLRVWLLDYAYLHLLHDQCVSVPTKLQRASIQRIYVTYK